MTHDTMDHDKIPPPTTQSNHESTTDELSSSIHSNEADSATSASYRDSSTNDLTILTSALLLTADCMGTGILALPADVQTLGSGVGLAFLVANLPVNLYAGTILGRCALFVEETILGADRFRSDEMLRGTDEQFEVELTKDVTTFSDTHSHYSSKDDVATIGRHRYRKGYSSVHNHEFNKASACASALKRETSTSNNEHETSDSSPAMHVDTESTEKQWNDDTDLSQMEPQHHRHTDTATFDFVGMTSILFDQSIRPQYDQHSEQISEQLGNDCQARQERAYRPITYNHPFTKVVLSIYYVNLFLVLGNYILVMSHAVSAMAGEDNLCLPTAGIIASTLMFGLSQLRTMANLGRSVSAVSLMALFVVVIQCLYALRSEDGGRNMSQYEESSSALAPGTEEETTPANGANILSKMSSLASIGFAVGSQKLLLNIRHEMADRSKAAPESLSIALSTYGFAYIAVCILAGPTPPSFLFDAIPIGSGRRLAGLLLWIHVAVSYAINSQALCSSLDRMTVHSRGVCGIWGHLEERPRIRWLILTGIVAVTSYFVANAVPFFKVRVEGSSIAFLSVISN
eukprot:CCRYP_009645-RC/>CCRYP_009645-RC protein AED:0.38 eAED:0.38 QI:39/1/1/1/1/1/2/365/572